MPFLSSSSGSVFFGFYSTEGSSFQRSWILYISFPFRNKNFVAVFEFTRSLDTNPQEKYLGEQEYN